MRSPRVILIHGYPGNGKTTVGKKLQSDHGCHLIEADDAYVGFVKERCGPLYLRELSQVIYQHYNHIFRSFGEDLVLSWHDHLLNQIIQASDAHNDVVVEGYLLKDCRNKFEVALKEQGRQVFQIRMEGFGPVLEQPRLTVKEIAALGRSKPRKRR
jgi:cytidylate kinase